MSKTSFVPHNMFNENLMDKSYKTEKVLTLNKAAYIGIFILDLSKALMYDFHYGYIKYIDDKARLLLTDTDSLVTQILTNNMNKYF